MYNNMRLITEALFVGGSLVVYSLIIAMMMEKFVPTTSVKDYSRMTIGVFITGVVIHLAFEITRVNAYYCVHGNACNKL